VSSIPRLRNRISLSSVIPLGNPRAMRVLKNIVGDRGAFRATMRFRFDKDVAILVNPRSATIWRGLDTLVDVV